MKILSTEIVVNASKEKLWEILMNFDRYPEWNPYIIKISGKPHLRNRLKIHVSTNAHKTAQYTARVTQCKKYQIFSWLSSFLMIGILEKHHIFEIEELESERVNFIQSEEISGLLTNFFIKNKKDVVLGGFRDMNEKIKEVAES